MARTIFRDTKKKSAASASPGAVPPKRGRGRPPKYPWPILKAGNRTASRTKPFEALAAGKLGDDDRASIVSLLRARADGVWRPTVVLAQAFAVKEPPLALAPLTKDQSRWFRAAADSFEAREDDRAMHYLLWAFITSENKLMDELYELATIGAGRLAADKKRVPTRR